MSLTFQPKAHRYRLDGKAVPDADSKADELDAGCAGQLGAVGSPAVFRSSGRGAGVEPLPCGAPPEPTPLEWLT
mgnify:CR=1 FL=1